MKMLFTKSRILHRQKLREKSEKKNRENTECVMYKASKALESITARYQEVPQERNFAEGKMGHLLIWSMKCSVTFQTAEKRQCQSLNFNKS